MAPGRACQYQGNRTVLARGTAAIHPSLKIPVSTPAKMDDRIITPSWEDFQSIKNVMAVVCGLEKKNAILGALRPGLFKRLIIDDRTALAVSVETSINSEASLLCNS